MLLIPSAIDTHVSKDKSQNYSMEWMWRSCSVKLTDWLKSFQIMWNWYGVFFFKPVMILYLENDQIISNPFLFIVSEFVYSICAYRIISFWKGPEKDLKTLKSSSLHRSVCSKICLTLVLKRHHSWKKRVYAFTLTFEISFWNANFQIKDCLCYCWIIVFIIRIAQKLFSLSWFLFKA